MTTPDEAPPRPVVLRGLGTYEARPVEWLWEDRLPAGELSLLVGDGGLGKSTFVARIAALVSTGALRGLTGTRRVIVVLGEDDPARVLKARYRAAGCALTNVNVLAVDEIGEEPIVLPEDLPTLAAIVAEHRPELVIVDPVSAHFSGAIDTHRDGGKGGIRQVLTPLSRLAQQHGTTVVACAHLSKGNGPASSRIAGSAGLRNAARNVLVLAAHPDHREGGDDDGRRVLGHDKSNYGPTQPTLEAAIAEAPAPGDDGEPMRRADGTIATTSVLTIGGPSAVDYEDALRTARDGPGEAPEGQAAALEFLELELAHGPVATRELKRAAEDAGVAWRSIERAKSAARAVTEKVGHRWQWKIETPSPPATPPPPQAGGVGGDERIVNGDGRFDSATVADLPNSANSATAYESGGVGPLAAADPALTPVGGLDGRWDR